MTIDSTLRLPIPTIAEPTRASLDSSGQYGLPLVSHVTIDTVDKGEWDRIELPKTINGGLFEGDLLAFSNTHHGDNRSQLGYVRSISIETDEATINWYLPEAPSTTHSVTDLIGELNSGRIKKQASNLSIDDIEFLVGNTHPVHDTPPNKIPSIDDLTLTREYKRKPTTQFLNHPSVGHVLGQNYPNSRATFAARYPDAEGNIVALVDLTYPSAPALDGEQVIELKRYAAHPHRPANTGSWLISKALEWCRIEAFELCRSYTGIAQNEGILYKALGFETDDQRTRTNGDGWASTANRKNRSTWEDYNRGRYDKQLHQPVTNIHRRRVTETLTDKNQQGLTAFNDTSNEEKSAPTAAQYSLTSNSTDLIFARRDNNSTAVADFIQKRSNQISDTPPITQKQLDNDMTAVFCAVSTHGIIAALVTRHPPHADRWDFDTLDLLAYAATDTKYPHNTASHLFTKARTWAGYQGYKSITATPKPDSALYEGIKQSTTAGSTSTLETPPTEKSPREITQ